MESHFRFARRPRKQKVWQVRRQNYGDLLLSKLTSLKCCVIPVKHYPRPAQIARRKISHERGALTARDSQTESLDFGSAAVQYFVRVTRENERESHATCLEIS